jgi:ABC-type antimicrobial peptide transport system permease subunit
VRRVPGVTAAALTSQLPLSGDVDQYGVHFDPPLSDDPGEVKGSTREIGVRAALGATRRDILALVVRQGMTLTGLGVALGAVGSVAATQALVAMLFGVSRLDPMTYLGVIVLLTGVALMACGVPAWRAARVDPASTLRVE